MNKYLHTAIGNMNVDIAFYIDKLPKSGETIVSRNLNIGLGGAATNYAVAAKRAGHNALLCASTGRKYFYSLLRSLLEKEGIITTALNIHDNLTPGIIAILVEPNGERTMIKHRGANMFLEKGVEKCLEEIRRNSSSVIHMASISPDIVEKTIKGVSRQTKILSYDPGGVYAKELYKIIESFANNSAEYRILFLNEQEILDAAKGLGIHTERTGLEKYAELGFRIAKKMGALVAVKLGPRGAIIINRGTCLKAEPYHVERVIDTTAAGDVFAAYFNTYLLETGEPRKAVQAANTAAALKILRQGSALASPYRSCVEQALRTKPPRIDEC